MNTTENAEAGLPTDRLADLMVARGYAEAISYAFTSSEAQQQIDAGVPFHDT